MCYDVNKHSLNCRYLSDGISESELKNWISNSKALHTSTAVAIESATGTGKTEFIINKLFPYAANYKRNILYLSNRVALTQQLGKNLLNDKKCVDITESYIGYQEDKKVVIYRHPSCKNQITVLNYQSLIWFLNHKVPLDYYYIVCDEAHFFLEDSLFNDETNKIWDCIISHFFKKVFIFMSATIEEFYNELFIRRIPLYTNNYDTVGVPNISIYANRMHLYQNSYLNKSYKSKDNIITDTKVTLLKNFYKTIESGNKYMNMVSEWLNYSDKREIGHILYENCKNLEELLEYVKDKGGVAESEGESFYRAFQYYYKIRCKGQFDHDSYELHCALNMKKEKIRRLATIKRELKYIESPYTMKKRNNRWVVMDCKDV